MQARYATNVGTIMEAVLQPRYATDLGTIMETGLIAAKVPTNLDIIGHYPGVHLAAKVPYRFGHYPGE